MPAADPPAQQRRRAFSNGVSAKHLLILAAFLFLRHGLPVALGSASASHPHPEAHSREAAESRATEGEEGGEGGEEEEIPEYEVFHVDFEHVQLPFIISLWIFVSSLAKIGESVWVGGGLCGREIIGSVMISLHFL